MNYTEAMEHVSYGGWAKRAAWITHLTSDDHGHAVWDLPAYVLRKCNENGTDDPHYIASNIDRIAQDWSMVLP